MLRDTTPRSSSHLKRCAFVWPNHHHRPCLQGYRYVRTPREPGRRCCPALFTQVAGKSDVKSTRCACRRWDGLYSRLQAADILQTCARQLNCATVFCIYADRAVTCNRSVTAQSGTSSLFCRRSKGRRWLPQTCRQRCVP